MSVANEVVTFKNRTTGELVQIAGRNRLVALTNLCNKLDRSGCFGADKYAEYAEYDVVESVIANQWYAVVNKYTGYQYGYVLAKSQRSAVYWARKLFCGYDSTVAI